MCQKLAHSNIANTRFSFLLCTHTPYECTPLLNYNSLLEDGLALSVSDASETFRRVTDRASGDLLLKVILSPILKLSFHDHFLCFLFDWMYCYPSDFGGEHTHDLYFSPHEEMPISLF